MNTKQLTMLAYLGARIPPQAWDAIFPMGPKFSTAAREYFIAQALKGFAARLRNPKIVGQLKTIQRALVGFAAGQLAADYDDDNWCGTPPRPHPWPWLLVSDELNPQPEPPLTELAKETGGYLLLLSQATSQPEAAKQLEAIAKTLMGGKQG